MAASVCQQQICREWFAKYLSMDCVTSAGCYVVGNLHARFAVSATTSRSNRQTWVTTYNQH
jgi:hypothetical protein